MNAFRNLALLAGIWMSFAMGCGQESQTGGTSYETGNALSGRVLDTQGRALEGVEVRIRPFWHVAGDGSIPTPPADGLYNLRTDAQGRFEALEIPAGEYRIEVRTSAGGVLVGTTIRSRTGRMSTGDLTPLAWARLKGKLAPPRDSGRLLVQVYGTDHYTTVQSDGTFELSRIPAGNLRLRALGLDSDRVVGESTLNLPAGGTATIQSLESTSEDLGTWRYRQALSWSHASGGIEISERLLDFPLLVRLDSTLFPTQAAPDGRDLRLEDGSGRMLPLEIEQWDPTTRSGRIWTRLDTVNPGEASRLLRLHWGHSKAPSRSQPGAVWDTARGWSGVWHLSRTFRDSVGRLRTPDATWHRMDGVLSGSNAEQTRFTPIASHYFDGTTDQLKIGGATTELGNRTHTLELWTLTAKPAAVLLNKGNSTDTPGMRRLFLSAIDSNSSFDRWHPSLHVRPDTTRVQFSRSTGRIDSAVWTHLTVRMVPSPTNSLEVLVDWFINGVRTDSKVVLCKVADHPGDSLGIGNILAKSTDPRFAGWMGGLRISHIDRSDAWIRWSAATQADNFRLRPVESP